MINKEEIESKSAEFDIHYSNVQRDYIFGWILAGIFSASALKDLLVFKGGNCLRKGYFEKTRFSNDLDFTTSHKIEDDFIKSELDKVCDYVQENTGVVFIKERILVEPKKRADTSKIISEARIYFKDFYGIDSSCVLRIVLDVTQHDKIYLPCQSRYIIHPYSDKEKCHVAIQCVKLEEILASKLKCLLQRRHSFDLYDYVFSLFFDTGLDINRVEVVKTLLKMTIFERNPGILRGLLIELPFQIFKSLWQKYLICPAYSIIDFDSAIKRFIAHIEEIFSGFPLIRGHEEYFPAKYRNVILEAGQTQCLLDVVYDGVRRQVEPYSLVYKTRKDGVSSEYFYVYDRTGGRSSEPGIKSFLSNKLQSANLLDEHFEPRYEVELSKAGEPAQKSYFGKGFTSHDGNKSFRRISKIHRTKPRAFHGLTGPVYVIECIYCGKLFSRTSNDTHLKKHKDKYGNPCYGRAGYLKNVKY
jgi:predicted nucleotidyltransferase component of viral defense system